MKTLKLKWTGVRPLLMHNGEMVDPTNQFVKKIKEITNKGSKKMSDTDHEQRNRLEWEASLYWDEELGPVVPADNIERCIQEGARKSRKGKEMEAAVWCTTPVIKLNYSGPRDKQKLYEDRRFSLRKGVGVQQSRIMRVRPMFPTEWSAAFEVEYDENVTNEADIIKACENAGMYVGLGDWRPKFGRFISEKAD